MPAKHEGALPEAAGEVRNGARGQLEFLKDDLVLENSARSCRRVADPGALAVWGGEWVPPNRVVATAAQTQISSGTPNEIIEIYNASAAKSAETSSSEKQLTVLANSWQRLEDDTFQWSFTDTQTQEASETLSPKLTAMKSESSAMMQQKMPDPVMTVEQQPINELARPIEPEISEKTEPRESEPTKLQQMKNLETPVEPKQVLPQAKASW